ncbi:hypothetical protein TRICHSKD4_2822 [Roseibium sp. TrichSKD4]|nr:hypothetical protein TRICHSKD4_2822 [Roseibium sp. TrichSKD4]
MDNGQTSVFSEGNRYEDVGKTTLKDRSTRESQRGLSPDVR